MKLAEALIERADLQKKIAGLRARLNQNAKVQEGENPAENAEELLAAFDALNAATAFHDGTLIDAIAERDSLKNKIGVYRELYEAAAIKQERYSRAEVKYVRCVDTVELQKNIDGLLKQYRKLDTEIQAANWASELAE